MGRATTVLMPKRICLTCAAPFTPTASRQTRCAKHQKPRAATYGGRWQKVKARVFDLHGRTCRYCGRYADTVDHVVPVSKGGTEDLSNLVPCCRACNYSKQDKSLEEWAGTD
jgi:5-methylcytosine-specific restriction endonuclease McrA